MPDLPVVRSAEVEQWLKTFTRSAAGRRQLEKGLQASQRYALSFRRLLMEQHLPQDLLYVAMVESGYDPFAQSPRGAAGIWQFTAPTASEYGLRQDRWVDERRDPQRSTEAAAAHFRDLYHKLGSWELVLAAYNLGYGAVARALRTFNTNDYETLAGSEGALPSETKRYVAKIMAVALISRNFKNFGFPSLPPARLDATTFEIVHVAGGSSLQAIAAATSVPVHVLSELNPALRQRTVPPHRYALRVPIGKAILALPKLSRSRRKDSHEQPYVVRFGETLDNVAARFGTTSHGLRRLNQWNASTPIDTGTVLWVPVRRARTQQDPSIDGEQHVDVFGAGETDLPVAIVGTQRFDYVDRRRLFWQSTGRENLEEVAIFFGVEVGELLRWNALVQHAKLPSGLTLQLFVHPHSEWPQARVLSPEEVHIVPRSDDRRNPPEGDPQS